MDKSSLMLLHCHFLDRYNSSILIFSLLGMCFSYPNRDFIPLSSPNYTISTSSPIEIFDFIKTHVILGISLTFSVIFAFIFFYIFYRHLRSLTTVMPYNYHFNYKHISKLKTKKAFYFIAITILFFNSLILLENIFILKYDTIKLLLWDGLLICSFSPGLLFYFLIVSSLKNKFPSCKDLFLSLVYIFLFMLTFWVFLVHFDHVLGAFTLAAFLYVTLLTIIKSKINKMNMQVEPTETAVTPGAEVVELKEIGLFGQKKRFMPDSSDSVSSLKPILKKSTESLDLEVNDSNFSDSESKREFLSNSESNKPNIFDSFSSLKSKSVTFSHTSNFDPKLSSRFQKSREQLKLDKLRKLKNDIKADMEVLEINKELKSKENTEVHTITAPKFEIAKFSNNLTGDKPVKGYASNQEPDNPSDIQENNYSTTTVQRLISSFNNSSKGDASSVIEKSDIDKAPLTHIYDIPKTLNQQRIYDIPITLNQENIYDIPSDGHSIEIKKAFDSKFKTDLSKIYANLPRNPCLKK